eukprot:s3012_g8.t1
MEWSSFYRYAYFLHFERRLEALPAGFLLAVLHPHDRFYCPFPISRALQVSVLLNLVVTKIVAPARSLILNASCRHEPLANMTSPVCAVGKVKFWGDLILALGSLASKEELRPGRSTEAFGAVRRDPSCSFGQKEENSSASAGRSWMACCASTCGSCSDERCRQRGDPRACCPSELTQKAPKRGSKRERVSATPEPPEPPSKALPGLSGARREAAASGAAR